MPHRLTPGDQNLGEVEETPAVWTAWLFFGTPFSLGSFSGVQGLQTSSGSVFNQLTFCKYIRFLGLCILNVLAPVQFREM